MKLFLSVSKQGSYKNLKLNFVFSTNGPKDKGTSGGAVRELELMKRVGANPNIVLWVISSKTICDRFQKNGVRAYYRIVPHLLKQENFGAKVIDSVVRSIYVSLLPFRVYSENLIVHSPSDFLWDTFPAFIKKTLNKKLYWFASVYHVIPHPSERPGGLNFSNLVSFIAQHESLLLLASKGDMIQTETNFVKDELIRQYKISPEKIFVCQSGIDPKVIDSFSWNEQKIYDACFLARLHKSKGIFDLIDAWQYVRQHKKDAKLAIAGDGSVDVVNAVKNRIKALHLENNVFYLGFLSEEGKYRLYKESKLYVLPSYEEGIPITFYEAMYCGLPVVTYYLPTYSDIEKYVVTVSLGDVDALGDQVLRILDDPDLFHAFGEGGRSLAEKHTWDNVAEAIISQIFKQINLEKN